MIVAAVIILGVCFCFLGTAYWLKVAEVQRVSIERDRMANQSMVSYQRGYEEGVATMGATLKDTILATTESITKIIVGEVSGPPEVERRQPDASEQTPNPSWYEWEEADRPITDIGVGDSVFVDRDAVDRVAALDDGESIIPGIPLPDMSGEREEV